MLNIDKWWYQDQVKLWPLVPLAWVYEFLMNCRRKLYQCGIFYSKKFPIPVIVVGNITTGGTGKTPLVMHIVELLSKQGWQPGIVTSGYKGNHKKPEEVSKNSNPKLVGDEALVLANRLACPIVVGRKRVEALQTLLEKAQVNIVVTDDGLQHYALQRDIEIAVIDGKRRFGNGYCLPAGPLREPKNRLSKVDFIVNNGENRQGEYPMEYIAGKIYRAKNTKEQQSIDSFRGKTVHAVAGIGNPTRFFELLTRHGINLIPHAYPDHHAFSSKDIHFNDNLPVFLTEKDVVKCFSFVSDHHWVIPIEVAIDPLFDERLLTAIKGRAHG